MGEKKVPVVGKMSKAIMYGAAVTSVMKHNAKEYYKKGKSFWKAGDSSEEKKMENDKKEKKIKKKSKKTVCTIHMFVQSRI